MVYVKGVRPDVTTLSYNPQCYTKGSHRRAICIGQCLVEEMELDLDYWKIGDGRRLKDQRTLTLSHTEQSGHRNPMVSKLRTTGTILLGIYTVGRVTVTVTVTQDD